MTTKKKTTKKKTTKKAAKPKATEAQADPAASGDQVSPDAAAEQVADEPTQVVDTEAAAPTQPDPEPSPLDEEREERLQVLPPIPTQEELIADGFDLAAAEIIISHMTAIHVEVGALQPPTPMKLVPGLSIRAKNPKGFGVCGVRVLPEKAWEPALTELNESQRAEIETVKQYLSVEEVMVERPE